MVDPSETGSECEGTNRKHQPDGDSSTEKSPNEHSEKKTCADCGTTKTPLWRGGPAGPKSLCNACGIKSRKKRRRAMLGPKARKGDGSSNNKLGEGLKRRFCDLGRDVMMQRSTVRRKQLGEEEEAAVLLMALSSYGSVSA